VDRPYHGSDTGEPRDEDVQQVRSLGVYVQDVGLVLPKEPIEVDGEPRALGERQMMHGEPRLAQVGREGPDLILGGEHVRVDVVPVGRGFAQHHFRPRCQQLVEYVQYPHRDPPARNSR